MGVNWQQVKLDAEKTLEAINSSGKSFGEFLNTTKLLLSTPVVIVVAAANQYILLYGQLQNPQVVMKNAIFYGITVAQEVSLAVAPGIPYIDNKLGRAVTILGNLPDLNNFKPTVEKVKSVAKSLGAPESEVDSIWFTTPAVILMQNNENNNTTMRGGGARQGEITSGSQTLTAMLAQGNRAIEIKGNFSVNNIGNAIAGSDINGAHIDPAVSQLLNSNSGLGGALLSQEPLQPIEQEAFVSAFYSAVKHDPEFRDLVRNG